jgi:hypothetical protein
MSSGYVFVIDWGEAQGVWETAVPHAMPLRAINLFGIGAKRDLAWLAHEEGANSMANEQFVSVIFDTDGPAWHQQTAERLWAIPVGISLYRLENSPLYAYGVSYKDVVVARPRADGGLAFQDVQSRGGHSTYRVVVKASISRVDFERCWKPLEELGCTYESSRDPENIFAIDVPPSTDVYAVYALLEQGEDQGIWEFEEGHCGHPLRK